MSIKSVHFLEIPNEDDIFSSSMGDTSSTMDSNYIHSTLLHKELVLFCLNLLTYLSLLILLIEINFDLC